MFKSIEIKNFRGIKQLSINDLGRINLLLGGNGSGKTTVLEALSIASVGSPNQLTRISGWRNFSRITRQSPEAFTSLFFGMDTSIRPTISFNWDAGQWRVEISALDQPTESSQPALAQVESLSTSSQISNTFYGVCFCVIDPDEKRLELKCELVDEGVKIHSANPGGIRPLPNGCFFVSSRQATSLGETAEVITKLAVAKKKKMLIDALREFEPRIQDIVSGYSNGAHRILVDVGGEAMTPMNVLGDGFCRVALFVTGVLMGRPPILIIDDIDSGIHHSNMSRVWRLLNELCRMNNVQLFATTHNEEMIGSLVDTLQNESSTVRAMRFSREAATSDVRVTSIGFEDLSNARKLGLEVR